MGRNGVERSRGQMTEPQRGWGNKNMAVVEIGNWRKQWTVKRDDETVGRYPTEAEAKIAAEIARCADKWPPKSGSKRIRWRAGRWEYSYNGKTYRDIDLDKVIKFRDKRTRNRHEREEREKKEKEATAKKNSGCAKCVWRLTEATGTAGKRYHCGYSLCYGHHSRVWLHYQRTGKESLEGMTFGTDCTEFMAGNPDNKKTLMQEDLTRISEKAWALLEKEGVITRGEKTPADRKPYALTADLDMEKARELKSRYTWREIATAAGLSINGAKGSWERQRINRNAAKRLLDAYGIDITK